jgi:hypothetical protein
MTSWRNSGGVKNSDEGHLPSQFLTLLSTVHLVRVKLHLQIFCHLQNTKLQNTYFTIQVLEVCNPFQNQSDDIYVGVITFISFKQMVINLRVLSRFQIPRYMFQHQQYTSQESRPAEHHAKDSQYHMAYQ